jgi:hypothetical protein
LPGKLGGFIDSNRLTPPDFGKRLLSMPRARTAICPKCGQGVELDKFMQPVRTLTCRGCKAKLEMAQTRASRFVPLIALLPILFSSSTRLFPGHSGARIFLMGALFGGYVVGLVVLAILWRWEWRHPVLRIRKLPKPEIALNLNLKDPENIRTLR